MVGEGKLKGQRQKPLNPEKKITRKENIKILQIFAQFVL